MSKMFITPAGTQSLLRFIEEHQGEKLVYDVHEPKRTLVRNAQLHAVITDVAKQVKWGGEWMEIEDWKRLLTAGWMRATDRQVKLVPAIDGYGFDVLYQRTSKLTEGECRELIQYIYAWGVDEGVKFKDPHEDQAA